MNDIFFNKYDKKEEEMQESRFKWFSNFDFSLFTFENTWTGPTSVKLHQQTTFLTIGSFVIMTLIYH